MLLMTRLLRSSRHPMLCTLAHCGRALLAVFAWHLGQPNHRWSALCLHSRLLVWEMSGQKLKTLRAVVTTEALRRWALAFFQHGEA